MKKQLIATVVNGTLCLGFASAYEPAAEQPNLVVRKFELDPSSGFASMTWSSVEGRTYAIEELEDPKLGWRQSVETIQGVAGETHWTFQPKSYSNGTKLFRVRELPAFASNDDGSEVSDRVDESLAQRSRSCRLRVESR